MRTHVGSTELQLIEGDIAEQDTDAVVVTAAHWKLHGGDGTDGGIHSKGGPIILEECRKIGSCPMGGAVITGAGKLRARHVIHAVGPIYIGDEERDAELLTSAYRSSLQLAAEHHLQSISFPSVSTGAFGYPMALAAPIALKAICGFLKTEHHSLKLVRMVLYPDDDADAYRIYQEALNRLLPQYGRDFRASS